jgi:hypothetical protein
MGNKRNARTARNKKRLFSESQVETRGGREKEDTVKEILLL